MPKGNCKHEQCEGPSVGKGYCKRHYRAWKVGKLPKARYKICTHEACRKPRAAGSKCSEHQPVSKRAIAAAAAVEKAEAAAKQKAAEPPPVEVPAEAPADETAGGN